MLPNFILIGAGKSGTTSIFSYLGQHPDVYMSPVKEPNFFAYEGARPHFKGPGEEKLINDAARTDIDSYERLFDGVTTQTAIGEASTAYLIHKGVAQRIRARIPDVRLIAIFRNPADRAFSMYKHLVRDGYETLSFEDAIGAEAARNAAGWSKRWQYSTAGKCSEIVAEYIDIFPKEQRLFCLYEDLKEDPAALMRRIHTFLDIDPDFVADTSRRMNVSGRRRSRLIHRLVGKPNRIRRTLGVFVPRRLARPLLEGILRRNLAPMTCDEATRRRLIDGYEDEILHLSELLERDLSHWLD